MIQQGDTILLKIQNRPPMLWDPKERILQDSAIMKGASINYLKGKDK